MRKAGSLTRNGAHESFLDFSRHGRVAIVAMAHFTLFLLPLLVLGARLQFSRNLVCLLLEANPFFVGAADDS